MNLISTARTTTIQFQLRDGRKEISQTRPAQMCRRRSWCLGREKNKQNHHHHHDQTSRLTFISVVATMWTLFPTIRRPTICSVTHGNQQYEKDRKKFYIPIGSNAGSGFRLDDFVVKVLGHKSVTSTFHGHRPDAQAPEISTAKPNKPRYVGQTRFYRLILFLLTNVAYSLLVCLIYLQPRQSKY